MSRFYRLVAFSVFIHISCFSYDSFAQQLEEEALINPVTVSREVGIYKGINSLPESIRRTKPFARMLFELKHYAGFEGVDNREARLEAFEQSKADILRDAMTSDKVAGSQLPVFASAWTNVGPINTAGCTKAMAFDPTDGNTIYAGGAAGGVWKTTNAGSSWTALTDLVLPDLAVSSIAVDPSSPTTIYVGSGDPSIATDGLPGTGLYKSTDAGATWSHLATLTLPATVNKVLVDPTNSKIVFACRYDGNKGLYRSTDGGTTFAKVFPATKNADGVIWDIAAAQVIAGKLLMYLVEGNQPPSFANSSTECGIYKSLDDGATWIKISAGGLPAGNNIGKAALAIPSDDKTKIYCLMANPSGDLSNAGLWKSVNSGVTFNNVSVPSTLFNPQGNGAQGWYDLYLAIAPTTNINDTLYIGGVEAYYSFNSGSNWTVYSDYSGNTNVHVDNQSIALDPTNTRKVYIGTDGGVYRSIDAGQTWSYRSTGMQTMRFYHIGLDAKDYLKTYGGAQDQGIWRVVSGQNPAFIFGGDGFQPIVDPTNENTVYTEGPFGSLFKSTDGGNNFSSIDAQAFQQSSGSYEPSDWETPFAMAPKTNTTLFTGRQRVWQTVNSGSTWNPISTTFVYNGNTYFIESLGLSPANSQYCWAGLEGGKIQLTTNSGTNWSDKSSGLPGGTVRSIVCSPTDQTFALAAFEVYGTSSPRVMVTKNSGTTWTNVSGTNGKILPGVPVNCVALDSTSPSTVWYAATDNGIYYTRDGGTTWSIAGSGLGLSPCWDVQVHANKVTIRVGTHGRSIWEGNVNILPVELEGLVATKTSSGTKLDWKTDSEVNNSGFWVERSYNYQAFEDIYFQAGAGNSNTPISYSYFDTSHVDGDYIYRLNEIDLDGSSHLSNVVEVHYGTALSGLRLDQSFPNPFFVGQSKVGSVRIRYELPDADQVTLKIYSTSGAPVRMLVDHIQQSVGEQDAFWDGTDNNGIPVSAGVFYYVLETASGGRLWNKMIMVGK